MSLDGRANSRRPAAPFRQSDLDSTGIADLAFQLSVIIAARVGVLPGLPGSQLESARRQEIEIDLEFTRSPIGHCADIPVTPFSSGDHYIVPDFGVERFRFVPYRRNRA